jgi:hypothetical protein
MLATIHDFHRPTSLSQWFSAADKIPSRYVESVVVDQINLEVNLVVIVTFMMDVSCERKRSEWILRTACLKWTEQIDRALLCSEHFHVAKHMDGTRTTTPQSTALQGPSPPVLPAVYTYSTHQNCPIFLNKRIAPLMCIYISLGKKFCKVFLFSSKKKLYVYY